MIYKIGTFFILIFVLSGCLSTPVAPNQKAFEQEDRYIMFALRAEELKEYHAASSIYDTLYEKSAKKEYLYKSLENELLAKEYQAVIAKVDDITQGDIKDFALIRMKILALIYLGRLEEAKSIAINLVKKSNEVEDYLLVGDIYVKQKKYDTAVKYLESAYVKDYNEKILDKMAIILYVNLQRKKDAIAQLETHTRVHGCSDLICSRLIGFYSNENNVDGLLSVYLRMYQMKPKDSLAMKIVQIYQYKQEYIKLVDFLETSGADDDLLLQLYIGMKDYKLASKLAQKLYSKTADLDYLGQSAIYEYESSEKKSDKKMLKKVTRKLKKVVDVKQDVVYYNYYGYLLIDHDLDVKEGMKYINKALKLNPNSAFYLDSLAWGYYKLGKCKKANAVMDKVVKLPGGDNEEVVKHIKTIKKCMKIQNKKAKK